MATKAVVDNATLDAIGQAIITKGGATAPMKPSEMPAAIAAIPSGGSDSLDLLCSVLNGSFTGTELNDSNFFDKIERLPYSFLSSTVNLSMDVDKVSSLVSAKQIVFDGQAVGGSRVVTVDMPNAISRTATTRLLLQNFQVLQKCDLRNFEFEFASTNGLNNTWKLYELRIDKCQKMCFDQIVGRDVRSPSTIDIYLTTWRCSQVMGVDASANIPVTGVSFPGNLKTNTVIHCADGYVAYVDGAWTAVTEEARI